MARWLPPGISSGNVIAAYEAEGAASYAASKINLANPGTYDITNEGGGGAPTWDATKGWIFPSYPDPTCTLFGPPLPNGGTCSVIMAFSTPTLETAARKNYANDAWLFGIGGNGGIAPLLALSAIHGSPGTPGSPTQSFWFNGDTGEIVSGLINYGGYVAIAGRDGYFLSPDDYALGNPATDVGIDAPAWVSSLAADHRFGIGGLSVGSNGANIQSIGNIYIKWVYIYDVVLTAAQIDDIIYPLEAPITDFSGTPRSGYSCLDVAFTNLSASATSFFWDFGDGATSTAENPSHTYCGDGPWTVALTATNDVGSDTETKVAYITITETTTFTLSGAASTYMIWLNSPTGEHIAAISEFFNLRAVRTVNDIGALTLTIPAVFGWDVISGRRDLQLEIWRKTFGGHYSLLTDTVWLVRKMAMERVSGALQYTLSAVSLTDLLTRRIVYAYTGDGETSKTGSADDMAKAIVRENMGALVTDSARGLSAYVGVASDLSLAPSIEKKFGYRNVLQVLQEIAQTSTALGTPLFFDIEAASSNNFNFYTYVNQRGRDRSSTTGDNSLVISELTGALVGPTWQEDYMQEITYVYAGGEGNGAARIVGMAPSSTSTEYGRQFASPYNRREAWADARNGYATVAACEYEAENVLRAGRPRKTFTGRIIDTPQSIYSLNWNWGDKVTAVFDSLQVDCLINTLDIDATRDRETISAQLRSVE